jgi:arsenite methyltransferase
MRGLRLGAIPLAAAVPLLALLAGAASCVPTLKDEDGHKIFNPVYLFFLDAPGRKEWQKPDLVIAALELSEGRTVADIGAGSGYFTGLFSRRVGPSGRVYATDVQDIMIRKLERLKTRERLDNVTVIRSTYESSGVPAGSCDLVFFSSVYKEIDRRDAYLAGLKTILKPGGRVAVIEYRLDADAWGPEKIYRLPESTVMAEFEAAGFRLERSFDFLPWEYFLVFGLRDESPAPGHM